jgi:hypothetical protein
MLVVEYLPSSKKGIQLIDAVVAVVVVAAVASAVMSPPVAAAAAAAVSTGASDDDDDIPSGGLRENSLMEEDDEEERDKQLHGDRTRQILLPRKGGDHVAARTRNPRRRQRSRLRPSRG